MPGTLSVVQSSTPAARRGWSFLDQAPFGMSDGDGAEAVIPKGVL